MCKFMLSNFVKLFKNKFMLKNCNLRQLANGKCFFNFNKKACDEIQQSVLMHSKTISSSQHFICNIGQEKNKHVICCRHSIFFLSSTIKGLFYSSNSHSLISIIEVRTT
jgi:hypothetical protein